MKKITKVWISLIISLVFILQLFPGISLAATDSFGTKFREIKQNLRQFSVNEDTLALEKAKNLFNSIVDKSSLEEMNLTEEIYQSFEEKKVDQIPYQILKLAYETTKIALDSGNIEEASQWFEIRESKLKFEKEATPAMKAMVELKKNPDQINDLKRIIMEDLKNTYIFKMKEALNHHDDAAAYYFRIVEKDLEKEFSREDFNIFVDGLKDEEALFGNEEKIQDMLQILHTYEAQKISDADVKAESEKIVKLISYVRDNWGVAIKEGEVFNGVEFAELNSFIEEATQRFLQIKPAFEESGDEIETKLSQLGQMLSNKESKETSQIVTKEIIDGIVKQTNIKVEKENTGKANLQEIQKQTFGMLDEAIKQYEAGNEKEAYDIMFEAYFTFEPLEKNISSRDQQAVQEIESAFATIKGNIQNNLPINEEIQSLKDLISKSLMKANAAPSNWEMFIQSLIIIIRDGFEAILIIGALVAYMLKTGQKEQTKYIYFGSIAAIIVSFIAAYLIRNVFKLSGANQEALEGITMLIAVVVLFYVSYWLISKVQGQKWQEYIKGKLQHSVSKGNLYTMSFVAFLAVFREGFETILFYEALLAIGDDNQYIVYGFLLGCIALIFLYILISKFSIRIPIKPFFTFTSILLYFMAFSFAGHGLFELQEGGYVSATFLSGWPTVSLLGIYPTAETLGAQAILLFALLIAVIYFIYSGSKLSKKKGVLGNET